ncbi:MAG: arsenate reductase family protein [Paracoccaceae bacterium]
MLIYGLKTCDTCRKVQKLFPSADFIDIRATPLERAFLEKRFKDLGQVLLNTRSTTWRGLSETERAGDPVDLILQHPALMKRPLIYAEDTYFVGWTKDVQAALGV